MRGLVGGVMGGVVGVALWTSVSWIIGRDAGWSVGVAGLLGVVTGAPWGARRGKSPAQLHDEYAEAVQLAMIGVMTADGAIAEAELRTIAHLYHRLTGEEVSTGTLRDRATSLEGRDRGLQTSLAALAPHLTDEGRGMVVRAAAEVAAADGALADPERAVVAEIAEALQVPNDRLRGTLSAMLPGD